MLNLYIYSEGHFGGYKMLLSYKLSKPAIIYSDSQNQLEGISTLI